MDASLQIDLDRSGMTELIYGSLSDCGEFFLLEKEAAHKQEQALNCSTWGDYAQLAGLEWRTFVDEWEESLQRAVGGKVRPDTPMDFQAVKGIYYVGDLIRDPCILAYEIVSSQINYREYPILDKHLNVKAGLPWPNVYAITATEVEALDYLEVTLCEESNSVFSIGKNETLVRKSYGF